LPVTLISISDFGFRISDFRFRDHQSFKSIK
jgi:hypothetical protein